MSKFIKIYRLCLVDQNVTNAAEPLLDSLYALGLRIRKGYCYHGLSLNVDMDLEPFARINPCGYRGLTVTQLSDFDVSVDTRQAGHHLADILIRHLGKRSEKTSGNTRG